MITTRERREAEAFITRLVAGLAGLGFLAYLLLRMTHR